MTKWIQRVQPTRASAKKCFRSKWSYEVNGAESQCSLGGEDAIFSRTIITNTVLSKIIGPLRHKWMSRIATVTPLTFLKTDWLPFVDWQRRTTHHTLILPPYYTVRLYLRTRITIVHNKLYVGHTVQHSCQCQTEINVRTSTTWTYSTRVQYVQLVQYVWMHTTYVL